MIHYVKGDATDPVVKTGVRAILHVCNDQGGWGRGFVLAISKKWKEPETKYRDFIKSAKREGIETLGRVQHIVVDHNTTVLNMIAQHGYKSSQNPVPLNYYALELCLEAVAELFDGDENITIHMPRIGCGLAGGNWPEVEALITRILSKLEVYVYDLSSGIGEKEK